MLSRRIATISSLVLERRRLASIGSSILGVRTQRPAAVAGWLAESAERRRAAPRRRLDDVCNISATASSE